jgi:two-component system LytT family sensor kinase
MRRTSRALWLGLFAAGVAYSLFASLVSVGFTALTGLSRWSLKAESTAIFPYLLSVNLVVWVGWMLFAPAVFWFGRRFPIDRIGWRRAVAVHVPAAVLLTILHLMVVGTYRFALQWSRGVDPHWLSVVTDTILRSVDFELPVYWVLIGLQHATGYYRQARAREVRAARLETRLMEAQLQALQQQLHPHFLFNTLHAISTLVHRDPDKAESMIERLSDLLRITLRRVGEQETSLDEELDYLRAYLDIEQVHFGDRLKIAYRIDATALDALVPAMILQPLAENAIRHGLAPQTQPGVLTIETSRAHGALRIRVTDTGRGLASPAPEEGVGLANSRARLDRLYGPAASLSLAANPGGGAVAELVIPFRTLGAVA